MRTGDPVLLLNSSKEPLMDASFVNVAIVVVYLVAMLAFGWWGKSRTRNNSDFLVAGRRLGPFLYTGTMAAVVLGGASTVGGVGLGYKFGISGMWLVVAIGVGVLLLSLLFASTIQKLKIYTVSQMLSLRYGSRATQTSGIVMLAYTLMLCATSTGAYATIFVVLFGWTGHWPSPSAAQLCWSTRRSAACGPSPWPTRSSS